MEGLNTPELMLDQRYLAHTKSINGDRHVETLLEHSKLTLRYYERYCEDKGMERIIRKLITECNYAIKEQEIVYLMFVHAIYLHDFGKINPCYQYDVLENTSFKSMRKQARNSNHSLSSAYLYTDHMYQLFSGKLTPKLEKTIVSFAYCIYKHHGKLGNGNEFDELSNFDENFFKSKLDDSVFENVRFYMQQKTSGNPFAFCILCRLLYSLIVGCDYCATQEFMTNFAMTPDIIKNDGKELSHKYYNSDIYKSICKYKSNPENYDGTTMNALRNQLFLEAENNLLKNPGANICYLEAPTGAGKTNIAINLTLRALQADNRINNIFYVFPFNTLVEQTKAALHPFFGDEMAVINSITPVLTGEDDEQINYDAAWLDHIFNNYPVVLTSHVNFFNSLFGCGRDQCFPLLKLCNSVVVMDEIQSYKNRIWREIISWLQNYARFLNIKIIIMSATLPRLDKMLRTVDAEFTSLIQNPEKYYHNPIFKERVKLDFSLLSDGKITLEALKEKVLSYSEQRVLIEFIKKKTAGEFYQLIKNDCNAVLLTGDDNAVRREKVIKRIRSGEQLILIATQVIEAGIDIDMDIGFKDISIPDAEEQFLGRLNRSCLNAQGALAFFFDYDDAKDVYRGDERLRYSINNPEIRQMFHEKRFDKIYSFVFEDLIAKTSKPNQKNLVNMDKHCFQLNFRDIEERMCLIEPSRQMFIPYKSDDVDGYKVWEEFKTLGCNNQMTYAQQMVEYSNLALKMSYFTFSVFRDKIPAGAEEYGGYYFIDGGEQFIEDGVLNRDALEKYYGGIIL